MASKHADQQKKLEQAIDALESQRAILGDNVVEVALDPLRDKLAKMKRNQVKSTPELKGERKLVTIMFADISNFTMLSENMDPEAIRELMNNLFDALVPIIEKYDGTVDKFIGDEIMALFGAPIVHENDPERALFAALEMMDVLKDFNSKKNTNVKMHIGINTGLVIAGLIGSEKRQQYSVMGDAVNLASRLKEASGQEEIYVGHDTYKRTATQFDFELINPIKIKGKTESVRVYRLIAQSKLRSKIRGIEGLRSSFVGREYEIKQIKKTIKALQRGNGSNEYLKYRGYCNEQTSFYRCGSYIAGGLWCPGPGLYEAGPRTRPPAF